MILSDKAKSLRASMPTKLVDYVTNEVTYEDAVETLFNSSRSFIELIAEFAREYCPLEPVARSYAAIIHEVVVSAREAIVDDAINCECEHVASIIDDPEEMAAYRRVRKGLLDEWEDHL